MAKRTVRKTSREKHRGLVVDLFAGGGGASEGLEMAMGRRVDIAINHDPDAIAMHRANHPYTEHYCSDVFEVDPVAATRGQTVDFLWASPDCKHFSKAAGGQPRDKKIRGLAWSVLNWLAKVEVRSGCLENVEEFKDWGPLLESGFPDPERKGETFRAFVNAMTTGLDPGHPAMDEIRAVLGPDFPYEKLANGLGFNAEHRELLACDYGAPTKRKRFFLYFDLSGNPIVWPEPTHGDPRSEEVKSGKLKPWRTAAEIIDWSLPCPSIFTRKKELAENTKKRIAKGIMRFVIDNQSPFLIKVNHKYDQFRGQGLDDPLQTITAKNGWGLVTPIITQVYGQSVAQSVERPLGTVTTKTKAQLVTAFLSKYHGETKGSETRGQNLDDPLYTLDTSNRFALHTCHLEPLSESDIEAVHVMKYYGEGVGQEASDPLHTVPTKDRFALVTSHLVKMRNNNFGQPIDEPLHTITAGGIHFGLVQTFLREYGGESVNDLRLPLGIIEIEGQLFQIVDICMRMLQPHELYLAQGFPIDYIIDRDADGKPYPKDKQVARCGNSVPPPFSYAIYRANHPDKCVAPGAAVLSRRQYAEIKGQRVQLALGL